MASGERVTTYPWYALEHLGSQVLGARARARRRAVAGWDPEPSSRRLSELASAEVRVKLVETRAGGAPRSLGADVALVLRRPAVFVTLSVEPAGAADLLARVLARPVSMGDPTQQLDASLTGALAAIAVEVARTGSDAALARLRSTEDDAGALGESVTVDATLIVANRSYDATAWVGFVEAPCSEGDAGVDLSRLGDQSLALEVVAGLAMVDRAEWEALRPGDAICLAEGWFVGADVTGRVALAARDSERGIEGEVAPDGRIMLRGHPVALTPDSAEGDPSIAEAVLDAPVVVRVELASVSLSAREWATLGPGDVVRTDRRIGDPAVLRVAGREVAQGELVNVEGELAVRIRRLVRDTGGGA